MKLIAIVEGHGDVEAVRVLLRRVLQEKLQRYDVAVERSIRVQTINVAKSDSRAVPA